MRRAAKRQPRIKAARKTVVDGKTFASRKEARRYAELKLLDREGHIEKLRCQVRYELQEGFRDRDGRWVRPITYIADFEYREGGRKIIEDVKGRKEEVFRIKWKMLQRKFLEQKDVELRLT